jgi:hypothetical protein
MIFRQKLIASFFHFINLVTMIWEKKWLNEIFDRFHDFRASIIYFVIKLRHVNQSHWKFRLSIYLRMLTCIHYVCTIHFTSRMSIDSFRFVVSRFSSEQLWFSSEQLWDCAFALSKEKKKLFNLRSNLMISSCFFSNSWSLVLDLTRMFEFLIVYDQKSIRLNRVREFFFSFALRLSILTIERN